MSDDRIALQLWTVREQFDADPAAVLHRVADIGYPAIELVYSRTGGLSHDRQREICDEAGLQVAAMHCFFNDIEDELGGIVGAAQAFGVEHVVCSWMDAEHRQSAASYRAAAQVLSDAGARLKEHGLQLAYHHHDFELSDVEGRRGIDYLWDVDADLLKAEVDTYWVHEAGLDVADYLESLGDRVVLLHLKDRMRPGDQPLAPEAEGLAIFNCEVGEGVIDFAPILAGASAPDWLITEQDFSAGDPFAAAATSLTNLRRMLGTGAPA
jgi:sugar phosphate isomerase/epimerase